MDAQLKKFTEPSTLFKGRIECRGCCYKVTTAKKFKMHLAERRCDQVLRCTKCLGIFKTLSEEMLQDHREKCHGVLSNNNRAKPTEMEESSSSE